MEGSDSGFSGSLLRELRGSHCNNLGREDSGLDQVAEPGEVRSCHSENILKVELTELADELDVGCEQKVDPKDCGPSK